MPVAVVVQGSCSDAGAVACTKTAHNAPPNRVEQFVPVSADARFFQAHYDEVWAAAGTWNDVFPIDPRDLQRVTNGVVVEIKRG